MHNTFYFQVKRLERLFIVILGRMGLYKALRYLNRLGGKNV